MSIPMLNTAVQAARHAGKFILTGLDRLDTLKITEKSRNDYVTEVDKRSEGIVIDALQTTYPEHHFLAEESGVTAGNPDSEYTWIIDPLDGTKNFIHGIPHFAVSIALKKGKHLEAGVIYDPIRDEIFTAIRGRGARLNERRIRVSQIPKMIDAVIGTGFPHRSPERVAMYCKGLVEIFPIVSGVRRAGSAALDLAYVAAGRLDAFWEFDLKPWDVAAGMLLIREAGGIVSDITEKGDCLETGNIVGGNPTIFNGLLQVLQAQSS